MLALALVFLAVGLVLLTHRPRENSTALTRPMGAIFVGLAAVHAALHFGAISRTVGAELMGGMAVIFLGVGLRAIRLGARSR